MGHRCQKHPSTNTAMRARVNRTSARRRGSRGTGASTRYRRPRRCSARRSASSGAVSRRRCRDKRAEVSAGTASGDTGGTDVRLGIRRRLGSAVMESSVTPMRRELIRTLDLFAGAGGLTAGLQAGSRRFEPVCAIELDRAAAATYALNHGARLVDGRIESDVVRPMGIEQWLDEGDVPTVDVVVGGPPCQGFSTLGKQDANDERNVLWRQYALAVRAAQPSYFVLENVPAFLTSPQYGVFLEELQQGGLLQDYSFEARILNAADFGAPQARKRVVVLGHRKGLPAPSFPAPTHGGTVPHRSVRDAFEGLRPAVTETELPRRPVQFGDVTLTGPYETSELHVGRRYTDLSLARFRSIPAEGNRFDIPEDLLAACWKKHKSGSGDVMGRLRWDAPAVTIRTEFFKPEKGRYLHPTQHRAITHREAAVLQGFPETYKWVGSKVAIARQIGNAVPIPLGAALGRHIV